MVYESDFYTTRRPYSRPTPSITSYSVTAQPFHRNLPFVAHKRLTAPQAPPPRSKVRNSILMAEIDRINHRVRPHPAYVPTEDWLNSACSVVAPYPQFTTSKLMRFVVLPLTYRMKNLDSSVPERFRYEYKDNFDDETRSIRAQTAALLKRVHSPIPRSRGPLHVVLPTPSSLMETPVPHRHTSDHYIEGLLAPISKVHRDVTSRSFYVEHPRPYIGKGNLACVSFAGGKAYTKRRAHYDIPDDHHNVQDDIATLSYYNRARAVANGQEPGPEPAATSTRKSRPYRSTTDSAPAPKPEPAAAPRPAAEPVRQASVKEDPAAEAAAEAELAAEKAAPAPEAAPATNGVSAEDDEAARLAAEEAELERQLEAELRAEMEAKEAKKAKKAAAAAAKKAKDEEDAKKAAEEAEAKRQAEEAAAKKAEEAAAAAAAAEADAAAEAARKAAEEEAELERQVAAELEAERLAAEAAKAAEEKAAAEAEAAAQPEPAEEVSNEAEAEAEAEAEPESAVETETEAAAAEAEAEPEPTPETTDEPEPEPEPAVAEDEPEVEPAASPEPEAIAEDDPVVEEPASEAEAEAAKSDEDAGWPADDE